MWIGFRNANYAHIFVPVCSNFVAKFLEIEFLGQES